jgi:hypothetical protein
MVTKRIKTRAFASAITLLTPRLRRLLHGARAPNWKRFAGEKFKTAGRITHWQAQLILLMVNVLTVVQTGLFVGRGFQELNPLFRILGWSFIPLTMSGMSVAMWGMYRFIPSCAQATFYGVLIAKTVDAGNNFYWIFLALLHLIH